MCTVRRNCLKTEVQSGPKQTPPYLLVQLAHKQTPPYLLVQLAHKQTPPTFWYKLLITIADPSAHHPQQF